MSVRATALAFAATLSCALFAAPQIADVAASQDPVSRKVTVQYRLTGGRAVVTAKFRRADSSGGIVWMPGALGDVYKFIEPSDSLRSFEWAPGRDARESFAAGELLIEVDAWSADNPPEYMVADLFGGYAKRYYPSVHALPFAVTSEAARTTRIVMRRIPAAGVVWTMGAPPGEAGQSDSVAEAQHPVTMAADYYLAVYPVTQKQFKMVVPEKTFHFAGSAHPLGDLYPADSISYEELRGPTANYNWPTHPRGQVAADSFLGKLQSLTGVGFDLPTEAEWEYACRAGTAEALSSGKPYTPENVAELGWFGLAAPMPVGLKQCNPWGLYDLHGSIYEWCLDWYVRDIAALTEPAASGTKRVMRGGSFLAPADRARSAYRYNYYAPGQSSLQTGFRLWAPAEAR